MEKKDTLKLNLPQTLPTRNTNQINNQSNYKYPRRLDNVAIHEAACSSSKETTKTKQKVNIS
jgi:hypothetical protein